MARRTWGLANRYKICENIVIVHRKRLKGFFERKLEMVQISFFNYHKVRNVFERYNIKLTSNDRHVNTKLTQRRELWQQQIVERRRKRERDRTYILVCKRYWSTCNQFFILICMIWLWLLLVNIPLHCFTKLIRFDARIFHALTLAFTFGAYEYAPTHAKHKKKKFKMKKKHASEDEIARDTPILWMSARSFTRSLSDRSSPPIDSFSSAPSETKEKWL